MSPSPSSILETLNVGYRVFFEAVDEKIKARHLGYFRDLKLKVYEDPQFAKHFCQYVVVHLDFGVSATLHVT